jgi:hypothetical protein
VDEAEAGKEAFLALMADVDGSLTAVIPSAATQDNFLIALSNNNGRAMIMVPEDDLIDLAEDDDIALEIREKIVAAVAKING